MQKQNEEQYRIREFFGQREEMFLVHYCPSCRLAIFHKPRTGTYYVVHADYYGFGMCGDCYAEMVHFNPRPLF